MKKTLLSLALSCFGLAFSSSAQTVISQNFESGFAPWTVATTGGGAGWTLTNTATATQLGTIPAHTRYAVVNEGVLGSTSYNNPTTMTSPVFSLAGVSSPYLVFDWLYYQAWLSASPYTHEAAYIEMSTDGGTTFGLVDSIVYSTGTDIWNTRFISLSTYTSATCVLRFTYTDHGGHIIGIAVDNIMVYGASATDIGLTSVSPVAGSAADYFAVGTGVTFSGNVTNYNATTAITSFTANYQVGSGSVVTNTISVSVPALGTAPFSFTTPYTVATASQVPVKIWVTCTGETNLNNDSMNTAVIGVAFMPVKRLLFEEATGTWCGWCVRGIVYMDSLWRADSNRVNIVSVHNNDPMANMNASTTAYDSKLGTMISGYPTMVIDRRESTDPSSAFDVYSAENSVFGFADMGLKATTTGGNVNATVRINPATTLTGDYRIELVVEEDNVTSGGGALGSNGWKQHNYYAVGGSGHSTIMKTIGWDFNNLPTDITTMAYPFVARTTLPANINTTNGIASSLPGTMAVSTFYDYTAPAIAIDPAWNASKLRVIALLIDNTTGSASFGHVLNSISSRGIYVGVSDIHAGVENLTVYPNPASNFASAKFMLSNTSTVSFSVYDMLGREVMNHAAEEMTAGGQQINFSTETLSSGVYNVVITTENGKISQHLSIVK